MSELIATLNEVYRCARRVEVHVRLVEHALVESLCKDYWSFSKRVQSNDYWRPLLTALGRFCSRALTTPLPLKRLFPELDVTALERHLAMAYSVDPSNAESGLQLFERLLDQAKRPDNPVLDRMRDIFEESASGRRALVLKDPSLIHEVRRWLVDEFGSMRNVMLITPHHLRTLDTFERFVLVGAARWFPGYVFSAPRAPVIHLVRYAWIHDRVPLPDSLPEKQGKAVEVVVLEPRAPVAVEAPKVEPIDPDELIRVPVIEPRPDMYSMYSQGDETVPCRFVKLAGGYGVFVEEAASILIVDIESTPGRRVRRIPLELLQPGMLMVLRTQGGGDLIVPIANRFLGSRASNYRVKQKHWKARLRQKVRDHGIDMVASVLRRLGCKAASEGNVRYWMADRTIRTGSKADFLILLKYLGLEAEAEDYWRVMLGIEKAHRRAGNYLRSLLLQEISRTPNLHQVLEENAGRFTLGDQQTGQLTAFLVEDVSVDVFHMPEARVGRPLSLEDAQWHA